jgi:hypothetical protein
MYPHLEPSDQIRVIQSILEFLSQSANLRESAEALTSRSK